jgi:transposase
MTFREVSVVQVREVLRRWLRGEGERTIARGAGLDRKTVRRYVAAAIEAGLERSSDESMITDTLVGVVCEAVRPSRSDGHGESWRVLLDHEQAIKDWVEADLTVAKMHQLLCRKGVNVPYRTLTRFAVERCGAGKRRITVRVVDPPPGTELQVDFGRMGLVPDGERNRVCHALIFTACWSRHCYVWLCFSQTTAEVIKGFEAAWRWFGGVFPVVIPDNMSTIVQEAEATAPRLNDTFMEYAQSRGFEIDAARVATPTDKVLSSHCTSWVGSDRNSRCHRAGLHPRFKTVLHCPPADREDVDHARQRVVPVRPRRRRHGAVAKRPVCTRHHRTSGPSRCAGCGTTPVSP